MKTTTMKKPSKTKVWKSWHLSEEIFIDLAKELGTKIKKFSYTTEGGSCRSKPVDGCECTYVEFEMSGSELIEAAERLGFVKGYNGGYRPSWGESNACYHKEFPCLYGKWGKIIQIWPKGSARRVG